MTRRRALSSLALAALAPLSLASECATSGGPGQPSVLERAARYEAEPLRADELQEVSPARLDALVAAVEEARGLRFIQRPTLDLVTADDPRLEGLRARAAALPLVRPTGSLALPPLERTFAEADRARVVAIAPPSDTELRVALAHVLDAQHYPGLVAYAPRLAGDPGLAVRALLAASALATAQGGLGPAPDEPLVDGLSAATGRDRIEPVPAAALGSSPILAAVGFLRALEDREAAFVRPPLSTGQILRPARWKQSDRPVALDGPPPAIEGCTLERDESLGLFALVRGLLIRGGRSPGSALAAWRGDRIVVAACAGVEDAPWIYVIELGGEREAEALRGSIRSLLPDELAGEGQAAQIGRRIVAWSGWPDEAATSFASALTARELGRIEEAPLRD